MMFKNPSTIGRYKVLGELGRGSMGIVYLAEDPSLKREVAIKLVHQGASDQEDVLARFRQEAKISARLNHPNVITVFDVGEEKGYGPFMAMEYADGEVLSDILARSQLDPESAAMVLIQGYHALRAAHALKIVHRDFKPENLILTRNGRLKLMDFGIAKNENPTRTDSGVLCTPSFAAPEILEGSQPTPETDNWAFFVTAFLLILGQLPFQTSSISSLMYAIVHDPPTFPAEVSQEIRAVFERALEKDPSDRYQDLHIFMLDLLRALPLDPPVRARCLTLTQISSPEGTTRRLLRLRRFRWMVPTWGWWAAGALAALALAGGFWMARGRTVSLTTIPPHAQVFIDGRPVGTTPLLAVRIPSGVRMLRVEKEGYQILERMLMPDDSALTLTLSTDPLLLDIQSNPTGAEVFVNNILRGITPVQDLPVAGDRSHHLQLRKAGYEPWVGTVTQKNSSLGVIELKKRESTPPKKSFWKRLFAKSDRS